MNENSGAGRGTNSTLPRRNAWRRHASLGRRSARAPGGRRHQAGDISGYAFKIGRQSAKGRLLMASRYRPRLSAGKKAVALAVPLVIGAASGLVMMARADPAIAALASVTHATPAASPATGQSPQTATATAPPVSPRTATPPHPDPDRTQPAHRHPTSHHKIECESTHAAWQQTRRTYLVSALDDPDEYDFMACRWPVIVDEGVRAPSSAAWAAAASSTSR
jgi:hypothetical protein